MQPVLPTLTPGDRRKRSRRGILFAYWYYIAARTTMGIVIAMTASGGQFGVARRLGVRTESIAFRDPRVIRDRRGTLDRSVRKRSACEEVLARDVWMID